MVDHRASRLPAVGVGAWRAGAGPVGWEAALCGARLAFSTRLGGFSAPPYDTLNLGLHVGDVPEAVVANREAWRSAFAPAPAVPVIADQVHGTAVAMIRAADAGRGWHARERAISGTDALVTGAAGVPLAILVADCAPVALVSPGRVLGVAHAGWRGLAGGVLEAALQRMAELGGGPPAGCHAVIGPCIRGCCYEVGEEVWRRFPEACSSAAGRPGARRLDLMVAVIHRLEDAGLPPDQIHPLGLCTACHPDLFFSHRRAIQMELSTTGRMALFAWL
jgi:YfiH family protein